MQDGAAVQQASSHAFKCKRLFIEQAVAHSRTTSTFWKKVSATHSCYVIMRQTAAVNSSCSACASLGFHLFQSTYSLLFTASVPFVLTQRQECLRAHVHDG
eukprot:scaffold305346_cov19-Tisochrysis_lutea.AAC.1